MTSASVVTLHTLNPGGSMPAGFFDEDNIRFIQHKIRDVLRREYNQDVLIDRGSIVRLMQRVAIERTESIPKMNTRVVMYGTNEVRNHLLDVNKHMKWEGNFVVSQRLYDPTVYNAQFDFQKVKLANKLGVPSVGGTTRFYFT